MENYQEIFKPVFAKLEFSPAKTFRDGPRFFVVGGKYRGKKAIFKADVEDPAAENRRAFLKLRREAAFLECGDLPHIPGFFAKGDREEFFWLLEELVPGESQEVGESTFLIKKSFFTPGNMEDCLEFLAVLADLPQRNSNPEFQEFKEKFAKRYTLKDYASLIASDKESLVGPELMDRIDGFIEARHELFDSHQTVIAHHEFYAPHIFVNGRDMNVIDWENVGWGNPAYDFTELWIRSFQHPDFQRELLERFRSSQEDKEVFDQLFSLEIILQGLGNLKYFKTSEIPEEQETAEELRGFLRGWIERVLTQDGKVN